MTPEQLAKLEAYFEKLDKLKDTVEELTDAKKWQASFLQSELGYKPSPDARDVEGNVKRNYRESKQELKEEFETKLSELYTTIHGTDVSYGIATKTNIMWKGHFPIWATITSGLTGLIVYYVAKVFK